MIWRSVDTRAKRASYLHIIDLILAESDRPALAGSMSFLEANENSAVLSKT